MSCAFFRFRVETSHWLLEQLKVLAFRVVW